MSKTMPAQEVKTRPIIFGPDSVRAILEGRKTQTRRVVKLTQWVAPHETIILLEGDGFHIVQQVSDENGAILRDAMIHCPYGKTGDRLWVREAWNIDPSLKGWYRADNPVWDDGEAAFETWRSPIFMPRLYSRITIELTDVRVERLQDIKTRDIEAEGILPDEHYLGSANRLRHPFMDGWDRLNKARGFGWDKNPYVWVLTFKRVTA